jgi:hypothetical protein
MKRKVPDKKQQGKMLKDLAKREAISPNFRREVDALLHHDRKLLERLT